MTDTRLSNLRVLVVDDSRLIIKLMPVMLKQLGIELVDTADNVAEAEEKIANNKYNIVFLDWQLPGKSGLVLLEECRTNPAHDNVAFVMVSGRADKAQIDKVLEAGAAEYIVKPFNATDLDGKVTKIAAWLDQHGGF